MMEQRRGHRFDLGDRSWQGQANCLGVDPDLFFPRRGASAREGKGVCRGCGVREDKRSLVAAGGAALLLPHRVPRAVALELLLTGEPMDAARAAAVVHPWCLP